MNRTSSRSKYVSRCFYMHAMAVFGMAILSGCGTTMMNRSEILDLATDPNPPTFVRHHGPEFLTFDELKQLVSNPSPSGLLGEKLDRLWNTPIIDNRAYYERGEPRHSVDPALGEIVRVMSWNIEKSVRVPRAAAAFTSEVAYVELLNRTGTTEEEREAALGQRELLEDVGVLILQEMDVGHCRSGHMNVPEYFAQALGMNYAYGTSQLEIDPVYLGLDTIKFENGDVDEEACMALIGEPSGFQGAFGSAVLSKYPIKRAEIFQLKNKPYDWYTDEIKKPDFLERGRRVGSELLFEHQPIREVKVGGRMFMRVDLHIPGLPQETLTVINVHLEIKATPENRVRQLKEILEYIREVEHPVVLAGDFNASPVDISATSLARASTRTLSNPSHLVAAGLTIAGAPTGINQARGAANYVKNYGNPTAFHLPVILPNKLKPLFDAVEEFRFEDGGAFDFRGDRVRSSTRNYRLLSNSNERPGRGFTPTFRVPRPVGPFGYYRLDWMFVKSFLHHPKQMMGPYRLAPHNPRVLAALNRLLDEPISDHDGIMIDLPIREPGNI